MIGAIEAGGTKWICAVGSSEGEIIEESVVMTTQPQETIAQVIEALITLREKHGSWDLLGVGTFGPIIVDPHSPRYGCYLNTPKEGWSGFDLIGELKKGMGEELPVFLDTDVNTAVLAEARLGAGQGKSSLCYVTVGTGIGVGVMMDGKVLHGRMHPEAGHLIVQESAQEPQAEFSVCPFHMNCVEGKASGTAMRERWQIDPEMLSEDHMAWDLEADYLAQLAMNLTAAYSPEAIVFGGGVMKVDGLLGKIRSRFEELAGGYWGLPQTASYLLKTSLENRAGLRGALLLAGE